MSGRMKDLWGHLSLPGAPFEADVKTVLSRVNGALNAAPEERKGYMRYKLRGAALALAAALLLAGSALAVAGGWDALSVFFRGDTSEARAFLQTPNLSVSDGEFTVTLESSVTDGRDAFLVLTVTALTEEAKARMAEKYFVEMETFDFRTVAPDGTLGSGGMSFGPLKARATEESQSFSLQVSGIPSDTTRVYLKFGFLPEDMTLDIPLDRAPGALEVAADFAAKDRYGDDYFFTRATLSPLTFQFRYRNPKGEGLLDPIYFFLMADGSIRTISQLLDFNWASGDPDGTGTGNEMENYTFQTVQSTADFRAIIVGGMAFPFGGGDPYAVDVDPLLYPFTMPHLGGMKEGVGPYTLSVRALCQRLGGTCVWDGDAQSATLTYRGVTVVLTLGSPTALVDGAPVALDYAPELREGQMALVPSLFRDCWGIGTRVVFDDRHEQVTAFEIMP